MITKTYFELSIFLNTAYEYRSRGAEKKKTSPVETKLDYAIDKTILRVRSAIKDSKCEIKYQDRLRDLEIDHALVDKNALRKDENGRYVMSKEGAKAFLVDQRKENDRLNETEIKFDEYICSSIPNDLTIEQVEVFKGIVIPADYEVPEPNEVKE